MDQVSEQRTRKVEIRGLWMLVWGVVAVGLAVHFIAVVKVLVLGVLAAGAVAALLRPVAEWVTGWAGGRRVVGAAVAGLGAVIVLAGVLGLAVWLVVRPFMAQMSEWPQTRSEIEGRLDEWGGRLGWDVPDLPTIGSGLLEWAAGSGLGGMLGSGIGTLANAGVAVLIVVVGAMYILSTQGGVGEIVRPALRSPVPGRESRREGGRGRWGGGWGGGWGVSRRRRVGVMRLIRDLDVQLRGWMLGTLVAMASAAVSGWVGYKLAGLRFAEGVALLAGLGEIVPNFGPVMALGVAVVIGATQSWSVVGWVVVVYLVTQSVQSYWIQPVVMRRVVKVPEVVTLFSVLAWGLIFGPAGLLLAVPLNLLAWGIWRRVVRGEKE